MAMWAVWWKGCNMGKYFLLQLKRGARYLLWGLCVVVVLFGCVSIVYQAMVTAQSAEDAEKTTKIRVGVVGTLQDKYLQLGLAAMKFDSTAMSVSLEAMEEPQAMEELMKGTIAAYFVFPDDFVDEAMGGNVQKLRFVSTAGATSMVSLLKEEITGIADEILIACESGTYGVGDALIDQGSPDSYGHHVNDMALEYVDLLFDRSKMYTVESLPQDRVPFDRYMLGGLTVVLLMLSTLPFAPLYIREDMALFRVLRARRVGPFWQTLGEFVAYCLVMLLLLSAVLAVMLLGKLLPEEASFLHVFMGALPAVVMMTALSYLLYSLSDHLCGGVLLAFFVTLALSFVGGCMYPVYFFPQTVQDMALWLPTGLARQSVTACLMGLPAVGTGALLAYSVGCFAIAVAVRAWRAGKVRG